MCQPNVCEERKRVEDSEHARTDHHVHEGLGRMEVDAVHKSPPVVEHDQSGHQEHDAEHCREYEQL